MLDGKYIVLIIQRTSATHDESVDIELRRHSEWQKCQEKEYPPPVHGSLYFLKAGLVR